MCPARASHGHTSSVARASRMPGRSPGSLARPLVQTSNHSTCGCYSLHNRCKTSHGAAARSMPTDMHAWHTFFRATSAPFPPPPAFTRIYMHSHDLGPQPFCKVNGHTHMRSCSAHLARRRRRTRRGGVAEHGLQRPSPAEAAVTGRTGRRAGSAWVHARVGRHRAARPGQHLSSRAGPQLPGLPGAAPPCRPLAPWPACMRAYA